jgi:hypothetical protein
VEPHNSGGLLRKCVAQGGVRVGGAADLLVRAHRAERLSLSFGRAARPNRFRQRWLAMEVWVGVWEEEPPAHWWLRQSPTHILTLPAPIIPPLMVRVPLRAPLGFEATTAPKLA